MTRARKRPPVETLETTRRGGMRVNSGRPRLQKLKRMFVVTPALSIQIDRVAAQRGTDYSSAMAYLVELGLEVYKER